MVTLLAGARPTFVMASEYVIRLPATAGLGVAALLIVISGMRIAVVSMAVLLAGFASRSSGVPVTTMVFVNVPEALLLTVPFRVNVTTPLGRSVTVMAVVLQKLGDTAVHDQVTPVRSAGSVSFTLAFVTVTGPMLLIAMV